MAIATLSIDIVAKLANIERDMNRFANVTQKNMSRIGSAIKGIVPAIAAVTSASAGFDKLLSSQRQFDVLNAGLVTATGSADAAADAFESLQGFASKTPYDLAQTTEAFTKLVNLGLQLHILNRDNQVLQAKLVFLLGDWFQRLGFCLGASRIPAVKLLPPVQEIL